MLSRLRPGKALQIFMEFMEMSGRMFTEQRLLLDRPEVVVRPEVWRVGLLEEVPVSAMAKLGEQAMQAALPQLRAQFTPTRRLGRRLGLSRPGR